jgi:hypothetical protein
VGCTHNKTLTRHAHAFSPLKLPHTTNAPGIEAIVAAAADFTVTLAIDTMLGPEGYSITDTGGNHDQAVVGLTVSGGDARGVLFGCGKLLRTSQYDGTDSEIKASAVSGTIAAGQSDRGVATWFVPGAWRGSDKPQLPGSFRAAYFATHYQNFYESSPLDKMQEYMEDIALWGVNTLIVELPGPSSFDDGERKVRARTCRPTPQSTLQSIHADSHVSINAFLYSTTLIRFNHIATAIIPTL